MNRIIKFELIWDNGTPSRIVTLDDINEMGEEFRLVAWIRQFTGLTDKNGREIYEGDILAEEETVIADDEQPTGDFIELRIVKEYEYFGGKKGTRYFGRRLVVVEWENNGFEPFSDSNGNCGHCGGADNPKDFEVIGNIHENPELLTPKE